MQEQKKYHQRKLAIIDAYETKIKTYINEDGNLDIKSGELFYKETFETNK